MLILGWYLWTLADARHATSMMLSLIVFLPLVGALLVLLAGGRGDRPEREPLVRNARARRRRSSRSPRRCCCGGASIRRAPSTSSSSGTRWIPAFGIQYYVGVDGISLFLIVLTGFLTPLALLSSWESVHKNVKVFSFFLLALETAMLGVFVSIDLFLFYMFWDAMLIPMYFLIGIWGYERRIYAAVKFILYTMAGSVLMLVAIIGLAWAHAAGDRRRRASTCSTSTSCTLTPAAADLVLPRVRAGVRDQGAAVPVPHLAARRARRGADRRLGDPGRRAAEDGHLRPAALRVPALPDGRAALRAVHRACSR